MRAPVGRGRYADFAEATVVVLAAGGDDAAFDELVRRRQAPMRGLLRRLSGDATLADDLAQQAFLQAWQRLPSLRAPDAFGAWLRQLAVNTWLAHARTASARQGTRPLTEELVIADAIDLPLQLDLDRALQQLRPDVRICIVLAYAEGLTHPEIATATGLPLGTVKSHVTRGAARLREWLED